MEENRSKSIEVTHSEDVAKTKNRRSITIGVPKFRLKKTWLKRVVGLIIIAVIAWLAYGYVHTRHELTNLKNPSTAGQTETQQIVSQVSKYVDLPTTEQPTLATVTDVTKLRNQAFFKKAQNGDKVLIYSKAGAALLYRPSTKKIIQYSTVNPSNQ